MYIEKKKAGKNEYYYLVKTVRVDGNFKKFREYLGSAKLSKKEIKKIKQKKAKILEEKVNNFLKKQDPLLNILSENELDELKKIKIEYSKKRITPIQKKKYLEWFITSFTYNSNSIEGSTLSLQETGLVLFDKITPKGKPIRDIKEAENHKKAFDYILNYKGKINKKFICTIHKIIFDNTLDEAGDFRKVQVYIRGSKFLPTKPQLIDKEFKELLKWIKKAENKYHPIVIVAYVHGVFESIHPFIDGNGRTGRMLLNFMLNKYKFPFIDIKQEKKLEYYTSLQAFNVGDSKPLIKLIISYLKESLRAQK